MKTCLFLLSIIFIFSCSDKRTCECGEDIELYWEDGINLDGVDIGVPNAVLNVGIPLTFKIGTLSFPEMSNESIEWNLQSARLFQNNLTFVDNEGLDRFVKNNTLIEFPHEAFSTSSDELITRPVSIDLSINFPVCACSLNISGTISFYSCEDKNDDFNPEECRWPSQVIGESFTPGPS
jgi:hypothetical protein